ncbi:hypothetical protein, partial [Klebsiella pneumoniae]|uniref:hypothetical protein n=1 Tax=Klebsiella pneumoniae TaxID=573 RepID=UPI00259FF836
NADLLESRAPYFQRMNTVVLNEPLAEFMALETSPDPRPHYAKIGIVMLVLAPDWAVEQF